jgi:drug/metabolite transporter (DMT)-like permease
MSIAARRSMTAAGWGLLIGLSVLWGGSFFFTEAALRELPAFTLVLLRVGMAVLSTAFRGHGPDRGRIGGGRRLPRRRLVPPGPRGRDIRERPGG